MSDDVIHLTQSYINYIYRAILANFQYRLLKLGRLIVLSRENESTEGEAPSSGLTICQFH